MNKTTSRADSGRLQAAIGLLFSGLTLQSQRGRQAPRGRALPLCRGAPGPGERSEPSEQSSGEAEAAAPAGSPRPARLLPGRGGSARIIRTDAGARPCRSKAGDLPAGTPSSFALRRGPGTGPALSTPFGPATPRGSPDRPGPSCPHPPPLPTARPGSLQPGRRRRGGTHRGERRGQGGERRGQGGQPRDARPPLTGAAAAPAREGADSRRCAGARPAAHAHHAAGRTASSHSSSFCFFCPPSQFFC